MMGLKEAYQEKADAQLREWQTWIDHIKYEPVLYPSNLQKEPQMVERLDEFHKIALARLDELCSAQEEQWELAKQAVERAMIDLKRALDESGTAQVGRAVPLQNSRVHVYETFFRKG
jgi:hypothetical protein